VTKKKVAVDTSTGKETLLEEKTMKESVAPKDDKQPAPAKAGLKKELK
jgi:hypothetical protein